MAGEQGDDPNPDRRRRRRSRRRAALRLSRLYSFACGRRPSVADDDAGSRIGGPGFSRVVNAGDAALRLQQQQQQGQGQPPSAGQLLAASSSNSISTTKYNLLTFLPKSLFEQFRRVANVYFLVSAGIAYSPLAAYSSASAIAPLIFVIVATMLKEAVEDWRRNQQDTEVNNRSTKVFQGGAFRDAKWKDIRVGDIIKVEKDQFFPADLVLLSSSYEDAICYVETIVTRFGVDASSLDPGTSFRFEGRGRRGSVSYSRLDRVPV